MSSLGNGSTSMSQRNLPGFSQKQRQVRLTLFGRPTRLQAPPLQSRFGEVNLGVYKKKAQSALAAANARAATANALAKHAHI